MFSNFFFSFENHALCEKIWKNIVERGRSQMTIWRTCIACWVPKVKNTLTQVMQILIAFPLRQLLWANASNCYVIRT